MILILKRSSLSKLLWQIINYLRVCDRKKVEFPMVKMPNQRQLLEKYLTINTLPTIIKITNGIKMLKYIQKFCTIKYFPYICITETLLTQ